MIKFIFLFIACSIYLNSVAQRHNTYFISKNGENVKLLDSAAYIRVVQEQEKGSTLYPTKEFYRNGNKKSIGYSSRIDPPKYEGQFISFFENGSRKEMMTYVGGKIRDTAYSYFPNGKLYSSIAYSRVKDSSLVYIKTVRDSTGKDLATDGKGLAVFYDDDFKYIKGKGNIKDGKYDGEWIGQLRGGDTLTYKEIYAEGKMLSGESNDGKGNVYHYTVSEIKPNFKGGMSSFYKYITHEVRYPRNLIYQRIQGTASIKFVILKNGEVSNVQAINDVNPDLAAEAIRVIKASKGWEPGIQKGRKVNVSYVVPVSFSMSN